MAKLTKRVVDGLRASGRELISWDDELPGFGIRVKPSGAKSWLVQYRNKHGKSKRMTLGRYGVLTPDQARTMARATFVDVAQGADPAKVRRTTRSAVTVAQLCDQYLEAGRGRIKVSTLKMDASRIERHVKPLLGTHAVADLTRADMEKFMRDVMSGKTAKKPAEQPGKAKRAVGGIVTGGPSVASRTLGMVGTILERAVLDGTLVKNPVRGIRRPQDQEVKPAFSFAKVKLLGAAIRREQSETGPSESKERSAGRHAIIALLLTGFRRNEALTLTWGEIDTDAQCVRFKDTKSGKQTRALGRTALGHFAGFKPDKAKLTDFVFPGSSKAGHLVGLPKMWDRTADRAGLTDVTLHGLRHWFASAAAELGYSDLTIGALLGHAKRGITARYATTPDPALCNAADKISLALADALDDKPATNVLQLVRATPN